MTVNLEAMMAVDFEAMMIAAYEVMIACNLSFLYYIKITVTNKK